MLKEFKEFAFKGNMIDMAVGIIIGAAFGTVVKSLVDNLFTPLLGLVTGGIDFSDQVLPLPSARVVDGEEVPLVLSYGQFITDLISFLLVAFAVFLVVKKALGAMKKEAVEEPEKTPISPQEQLLTEIRDLLKERP